MKVQGNNRRDQGWNICSSREESPHRECVRVGGELKGGVVESLWLPREEKLALEKKKTKKTKQTEKRSTPTEAQNNKVIQLSAEQGECLKAVADRPATLAGGGRPCLPQHVLSPQRTHSLGCNRI